ncbi:MAG: hypothetical protein IPH27_05625 [Actinomycetales bacterium]|nr:hypothetical protein [Candidatus Phosphoribacter baldrii]
MTLSPATTAIATPLATARAVGGVAADARRGRAAYSRYGGVLGSREAGNPAILFGTAVAPTGEPRSAARYIASMSRGDPLVDAA